MTPPPTDDAKKRAEALEAFKEYLAQTGLTPPDEQKRRYENIWKHRATIESALTDAVVIDAPIVEGIDEALEWYDKQTNSALYSKGLDAVLKAARLYAQGRTQAVPDGWKLVPIKHTQAMLSAVMDHVEHIDHSGASILTLGWYDALLSAAPPVTGGAKGEEPQCSFCSGKGTYTHGWTGENEKPCPLCAAPPSSAEKEGV